MSNVTLYLGDALTIARTLESESVQTIVTSPPYWGLRDYGVTGQLGLERTPEEYVCNLVELFRELRRVLRDDGVIFLNLGDSYNSNASNKQGKTGSVGIVSPKYADAGMAGMGRNNKMVDSLKPKDLIGIPWRVAFALQADGWYLRSDIIWHKPNPMPESVTDRPTKSHEYIFLLSKRAQYFYDAEAVRENSSDTNTCRAGGSATVTHGRRVKPNPAIQDCANNVRYGTKNRRSVWTIATEPFEEAHFATFPPKLITPCILAGAPLGGVVLDPFMGSGTTGLVSVKLQRAFVGIELNPEYYAMSERRIREAQMQMPLAMEFA